MNGENLSAGVRADEGQGDGDALDPQRLIYAEARASGQTNPQAAEAAGVSARTGQRWQLTPEIRAAIRERLADLLSNARAILANGAAKAATSLVEMSEGSRAPDPAQVSAARAVLDNAGRMIDVDELEARLADLEARLAATHPGRREFSKWT